MEELKQEPIRWVLDGVRRAPTGWKASGLSLEDFLAMSGERLHLMLMACVVRPEVVRVEYPDLWEDAKDFLAGIRSGALPEPSWWGAAHRRVGSSDCERSLPC